jgi:uncharacterized membrane protein YdcZ (DUF606 family)
MKELLLNGSVLFVIAFVLSFAILFISTRIFGVPTDEFGLYNFLAHPPSLTGILGILGMFAGFRFFVYLFI